MTTTTQPPPVAPYHNFGTHPTGGFPFQVSTPPQQSTTPPQTSSTSSSQHQSSPIQQDSSDCGSSSGVGGSGMTNKHESDASSLDGDSRDSGAGLPKPQHVLVNGVASSRNCIIPSPHNLPHHHTEYPSVIHPIHHAPPQPLHHHQQQQQQPRYSQPRHWSSIPSTAIPPPGIAITQIPLRPPVYTMTVSPGNAYDSRQQQQQIITAGPTMTSQTSSSTIQGDSSPTNNSTTANGSVNGVPPATSGIPANPTPHGAEEHTVFVHIQALEKISIFIGNEEQLVQGPATIRMTGNFVPPNALPLGVPMGHLVQQILDEHGRLKHVILSPQATASAAAAAARPIVGVVPGNIPPILQGGTTPLKGGILNAIPSTSNGNGTSPNSISPPVPIQFSQATPLINPEMIADPNFLAARNFQQQQQQQWNGTKRSSSGYGPPDGMLHHPPPQYAMQGYTILPPHNLPSNSSHIHGPGVPYNGILPGNPHVPDETEYEFEDDERERERLREALASIAPPQINRVFPKEVEISWQEIDTSEAAASGGPFPQIDASDFTYEVFVSEGKQQPACFKCDPQIGNILKIDKLKPNTQYWVNIRATLVDKDLIGPFSQSTPFKTLSILAETPYPPKVGSRGTNWMIVSWKNALNMSLPIKSICVQYAKSKGDYTTFCESTSDQTKIINLEPGTAYRIRIILRTDMGDTEPSAPAFAQTNQLQPPQQPQQHHNGPSSSSTNEAAKIPPPQITGCYNRAIRLTWAPVYAYTLEYCEARSNEFHPIDDNYYTHYGANICHLQSNREYYFRLSCISETGQTSRSECVSARTRKDIYENSAYPQQQQQQQLSSNSLSQTPNTSSYYDNNNSRDRLQIPTNLTKIYIDEKVVELSWRYNGREFETLIFVLEGSVASLENNTQPESSWRICYKGPNTSATVNDIALNLFRVQASNSKKHYASAWSEPLFVKRVVQRPKRSIPSEASSSEPQQQQQPSSIAAPCSPTPCTVPKFSEITWSSMRIEWSLVEELPETSTPKISLIYELQRIDTTEPSIIYSGDHTQHKLENLKPIEHVQVRARAVIIDNSGKRSEGDWSPIGSACTSCAAPSPPINIRMTSEPPGPVSLAWDPPQQLNGAEIKSYILTGIKTPLNGEKSGDESSKKLGETSRAEFSLGKAEPATHYSIQILAVSKGGESEPSETFEFDSPSTEPQSPQEAHIEAISSTELSLSWISGAENGSPISGYRLLVHECSSESRAASKHLIAQHQISEDVTSFIASKLKPETLYELEIVAKNSVGVSEPVVMKCETFASPPDAPELSLVMAQSNSLKLKWQPAVASSSTVEPCYFYLEKENDFGTFSPVFEGESRVAKIKNLHEDMIHRFRIRSAHGKGNPSLMGPWSETYEFATTRPPPSAVKGALMVSEVSQSVFQIEWLPVKLVANDGTDSFVYRLQVAPKPERRGALEPWKTVYEGTCPSYTLSLSPQSTSSRLARVFVVQKLGNDELISAPSAVSQFSSCRTPTESPRKRIKPSSGTSTPSEDDTPTRSPSSVHQAKRMNWQKRCRKWFNFVRKSIAERNSSALLLVCAAFIIIFACVIAYYQLFI